MSLLCHLPQHLILINVSVIYVRQHIGKIGKNISTINDLRQSFTVLIMLSQDFI